MKNVITLAISLIIMLNSIAVATNPVAYYPFNGNANDESGNGNHGVAYQAALTTDRFGNANSAYLFDGINDVISIANSTVLNYDNELSFSVWVKPLAFPSSGNTMVLGKSNYSSNTNYLLRVQANGVIQFEYKTFANTTNNPLILNQWNHVVFTSNSINEKLVYINNVIATTTSAYSPYGIVSDPLTIGAASYGNEYFNGCIDDILLYNSVLTPSEVASIFNNTPTSVDSKFLNSAKIAVSNNIVLLNQPLSEITQISVYNIAGNRVYETSIIKSSIDLIYFQMVFTS